MEKTKLYFASDFHLGIPDYENSLKREKMLVDWLDQASEDATEIFLMGDVFDFWFEYKHVIPKGYIRLLGKIAEITDSGIPVHLFKGNHDIWAFSYLNRELNVQLHRNAVVREFDGKKLFLAHGDGLGPGDKGYKLLKKVFEFKPNQFLFRWLHPDIGTRMGLYWSRRSRLANISKHGKHQVETRDPQKEMLFKYAEYKANLNPDIDYFIFGHRHVPIQLNVSENAQVVILGDWVTHFSYGVFEDGKMRLEHYKPSKKPV